MPNFKNLLFYHYEMWRPSDGRPIGVSVSGGRSSAYQAWHIVEANGGVPPGVVFHFQNSGRESPATLQFLDKLDKHLGLNLVYLEFTMRTEKRFQVVSNQTCNMNGEPFREFLYHSIKRKDKTTGVRPLPNPAQRTCTAQLKIKTWHRYCRNVLDWPTQYYDVIGYRADEPKRYERRVKRDAKVWEEGGRGVFPMYDAGVTTDDKEQFFLTTPFDLELESDNGNCDYCFMLSTWKIKERMLLEALESADGLDRDRPPTRVLFWIACEERQSDRPGVFRRDRPTYRQLWLEVCAGNLESSVFGEKEDSCGTCGA